MLSAVGVIPARFGSSRLPGKPLADLRGKPLLYHVYHRARRAVSLERVLIATDDERVAAAARSFDATVVMTRADHRSGTDRIAEAVQDDTADIVVNIQGDEPLLDFTAIDRVVDLLREDTGAEMATLRCPIRDVEDLWNPNVVKVISDSRDYAVYFSRTPIPFIRMKEFPAAGFRELLKMKPELLRHFYRHIGLYGYRYDCLKRFAAWGPSPLELLEDLEQLRAVDQGVKIKLGLFEAEIVGVDTPEDLERIRKLVGKNPKLLEV
jgi:3-deoxy-manno-octulosonate cytidylyltransferase (CMP-KDO synthetase)